jgi:hypothetical protein
VGDAVVPHQRVDVVPAAFPVQGIVQGICLIRRRVIELENGFRLLHGLWTEV